MSWYVKTKRAQSSIDDEKWVEGAVHPTLNAFDVGDTRAVVLVIEDVEEMVHCLGGHHPNASITEDVCCTLTSAMGLGGGHIPLVALSEEEMQTYPIQGTVIGRKDTAGPQGKGYGDSSDPMFTLDTTGGHAVAMAEDDGTIVFHPHRTDGFRLQGETVNTLTAFMGTGGLNTPMVSTSAVRRITPMECERLQGFPDNWTDGQADSHRYKQMGNAVTVNVIAWIGSRVG
jgi:DNA (cytosine-5)-methyltransferase 1